MVRNFLNKSNIKTLFGDVKIEDGEDRGKQELDDSLTNLQWLSGVRVNDILEGKLLSYTPLSPAPSNCSDDGGHRRLSDSSIDYRSNRHIKPPYSYAALIVMAMKSKVSGKMTLSEIYKWIGDNFSFYKCAEPSWQNSIRHNLSLNKCFMKIARNKGDPGKGGYWSVVPEFANKLLESNIRKRRTSLIGYDCHDIVKKQRLELLESEILCKLKRGDVKGEVREEGRTQYLKSSEYGDVSRNNVAADVENCMRDHSYGKKPIVRYFQSDEDNIKAIADNLLRSTSTLARDDGLSTSLSNVIRADCNWSSQNVDGLTESMRSVQEELLEARKFSTASIELLADSRHLSNSGSYNLLTPPLLLSPPHSVDDETMSGDDAFSDDDATTPVFIDNLTIQGTSMMLHEPDLTIVNLAPITNLMTSLKSDLKQIDFLEIKQEPCEE